MNHTGLFVNFGRGWELSELHRDTAPEFLADAAARWRALGNRAVIWEFPSADCGIPCNHTTVQHVPDPVDECPLFTFCRGCGAVVSNCACVHDNDGDITPDCAACGGYGWVLRTAGE